MDDLLEIEDFESTARGVSWSTESVNVTKERQSITPTDHSVHFSKHISYVKFRLKPVPKRRFLDYVSGGKMLLGKPVALPGLPRRVKVERKTRRREGERRSIPLSLSIAVACNPPR